MHVMEGFLPLGWAAAWYALAAPAVLLGARRLRRRFDEEPGSRPLVAVAAAFVLVLSSLKLPSVTGSCSHPTGTGLAAVLLGPWITAALSTVVLLYQALFLAHGGVTTLGANVFSMGVAGPFVGYVAFLATRRFGAVKGVFAAAVAADLATYLVTSAQLSAAYPAASGGVPAAFATFASIFALTQVPLALTEGVLLAGVYSYVRDIRPDLLTRYAPSLGERA